MDSRVDFAALDRSRLLGPNLPVAGTLGPMTPYGSDLSRPGAAGGGVTELTRTANTPATMASLAQYQSRFLPSTMSMHSPEFDHETFSCGRDGSSGAGKVIMNDLRISPARQT
ncbi:hypothetical protein ACOMHN_067439 [Nucella lapillus]